ncbi:MAG: serine/threonine-protein kinase [Myxococcota bacterium]
MNGDTEARLLRYVEGKLSRTERNAMEDVLDRSPTDRLMVAELARIYGVNPSERTQAGSEPKSRAWRGDESVDEWEQELAEEFSVPERYRVRERLGAGGMGVVLGAHDLQLDRPVAIKLLAIVGEDEKAQDRLIREARALACLSHPNIVQIYDVGRHQGRLYLTMEWVAGSTLARWQVERPRPWAAIVATYIQAGQGLAAAHAHGVVHRDFKPTNVLVGTDGRVRVVDFGLARQAEVPEDNLSTARSGAGCGDRARPAFDPEVLETLTKTGWIMGTPAYMSPEQAAGADPEPASDQYSFCVALHEALYGWRPSLYAEPAASSERFVATEPGGGSARVYAAIERGLSERVSDRWPSMEALLDELRVSVDSPSRRGWWLGLGGLVLVCAGLVTAVDTAVVTTVVTTVVAGPSGAPTVIGGVTEPSGDLMIPADPERREAVLAVRDGLEQVDTLRLLEQRARALDLARRLVARAETLEHPALVAAARLRLGQALVSEGLVADARQPLEQAFFGARAAGAHEVAMQAVQALVPVVRKLAPAFDEVERWTEQLCAVAKTRGDPEARAQCEVDRARLELVRAQPEAARVRVEEVLASTADDEVTLVRSDARLIRARALVAVGRFAEGEAAYAELVEVEQRRQGPDGPGVLRARARLATLHLRRGKFERAHEELLSILVGFERSLGPEHPDVGGVVANLALALESLGRSDEALAQHRRALGLFERGLGPRSSMVMQVLGNVGQLHLLRGEYERALEVLEPGLDIAIELYDEEHPMVAQYHTIMGNALSQVGRDVDAVSHLERALRSQEQVLGPKHLRVAETCASLGPVYHALGRPDEGEAVLRRALRIRVALGQARHPDTAQNHVSLGRHLYQQARHPEAYDELRTALSIFKEQLPPENPLPRVALYQITRVSHARRRYREAAQYGQRLLDLCVAHDFDDKVPMARLWLARALWDGRLDRERAVAEAERARAEAAEFGDESLREQAEQDLRRYGAERRQKRGAEGA